MTAIQQEEELIDLDFDAEVNLLRAKYTSPTPQITLKQAKSVINRRLDLTDHKPHRVMMHTVPLDGFEPEAQQLLFGPEGMDGISSIALLYNTSTMPLALHIEQSDGHKIPVKAFHENDVEAAETWSLQQPLQ